MLCVVNKLKLLNWQYKLLNWVRSSVNRLLDVISNTKNEWYIIFEYLDLDLEKYMVTYLKDSIDKHRIKVVDKSFPYLTIWYRALEILLGSPVHSTAIDVWSAGCIFAKMLMRQNLFAGASKNEHLPLWGHQIEENCTKLAYPDVGETMSI
ncbi:hypothetical protein HYC85_016327 [Camellia sinensis]|uniref:cyclin-dependent kinase n=1 Tax=Camellia sinensis TaxID=4442 RepID=A0A7J7GZE6_CAMSI|nr:hypothetical protein HYC85_016327 [Camellia sinensis]